MGPNSWLCSKPKPGQSERTCERVALSMPPKDYVFVCSLIFQIRKLSGLKLSQLYTWEIGAKTGAVPQQEC